MLHDSANRDISLERRQVSPAYLDTAGAPRTEADDQETIGLIEQRHDLKAHPLELPPGGAHTEYRILNRLPPCLQRFVYLAKRLWIRHVIRNQVQMSRLRHGSPDSESSKEASLAVLAPLLLEQPRLELHEARIRDREP